jgi:hypothetical protein
VTQSFRECDESLIGVKIALAQSVDLFVNGMRVWRARLAKRECGSVDNA